MQKVSQLLKKTNTNMENDFTTYLTENLSQAQYETGLREVFGSPHRRTKALNDPAFITHAELLEIASMLDVPAIDLIMRFRVGINKITKREIENLQLLSKAVAA